MLAVQKPQILANGTVNGTDFVTVGFKTGPNAFPYDYNVKCYNANERSPAPSCADIAASGNAPAGTIATGDLPYKYSKVAVNVTDLDVPAADCFVTVTGITDKDSKCKYAGRQVFPQVVDQAPITNYVSVTGLHPEVSLYLSGSVTAGTIAVVNVSCVPPSGFTTSGSALASVPEVKILLPVALPLGSNCTFTAYTDDGSNRSPTASVTEPTPPALAPSLTNFRPLYTNASGVVDIVSPQPANQSCPGGASISQYTVSYKMSGDAGPASETSTQAPGTLYLPVNSVQHGGGQTLELTVVGTCANGTDTPQGILNVNTTQCPPIANCQAYTTGTCTCATCASTYVPSSTGYACQTCPAGQYESAGTCTACTIPSNCDVATCTSASDSVCTQCSATYVLAANSTCVSDPCPADQYESAGTCTACTIPSNCDVATCTSASDSVCTQCSATYVLAANSTCVSDPCSSAVAGAAHGCCQCRILRVCRFHKSS
jgi:hypothetical protein